jgi:hypothetical protein
LIDKEDACHYHVQILDEAGCSVANISPLVRFLKTWPWTVSYFLMGYGFYILLFGRKHFRRTLTFGCAIGFPFVGLLITFEWNWVVYSRENLTVGQYVIILGIMLLTTSIGWYLGSIMDFKLGLYMLCLLAGFILSTMLFTFIVSFTGTFVVLIVLAFFATVICTILPSRMDVIMAIQSTTFLGAFCFSRGLSLLLGGYPSEIQMFRWLADGYIMQTEQGYFTYSLLVFVLYLIGQRIQRGELLNAIAEIESNTNHGTLWVGGIGVLGHVNNVMDEAANATMADKINLAY